MLPTVQFYSALVIKEPVKRRAANGSEYYNFTVQTGTARNSVGACIFCYDDNPLFQKISQVHKDNYVNMVCTLFTREAPAIDKKKWQAMMSVLKKIHITDPELSNFVKNCGFDAPKKDSNYFNVVALDIDQFKKRQPTQNQQAPPATGKMPSTPLTMEGF